MALKRELDRELIDAIHRKAWDKEIEKYGDAFKVPRAKSELISERDRAMYVLLAWQARGQEGSAARFMNKYALRLGSQDWALKKFCEPEDAVVPNRKPKRKELIRGFEHWATEHTFEQFTTAQLAEKSGFSQSGVLSYLKTSRYFTKVKRGLYEARDPSKRKSAESN
jgi:hypothetical protein|tara:strand:+ start:1293 stop:1793 length:501 start_codon:yes stop_codon:yes gene_type:complete